MHKQIFLAAFAAAVALSLVPSVVSAYGAAHVGYTHVGPSGVYHTGRTVASGPGGTYAGGHTTAAGYGGGASHAGYGGAYHAGYGGGAYHAGYGGAYGGYHYSPSYSRGVAV